tara:strand:- start:253 stop:2106 length:1854 start_codon:yes stop_codon:yes gene_type:complete
MSYWKNDEKIAMSQTQVAIPSTNGKSYTSTAGSGGKTVEFEIPPTVKFIDGKNSYLNFNVKLGVGAVPTRLQLDPHIGGSVLIKNIRIYSGSRAVLLEEVSDYNTKVAMEYSYNQDESLRKMRALKEGCLTKNPQNRGTLGTSESELIDCVTNPYYAGTSAPTGRDYGNDDYIKAKVSIPLSTGIFANSTKIFPCLATQGLFIEIDLEDCADCVNQLDSVNRWRRVSQNPVFHGIDAAGTAWLNNGAMGATRYIYMTNDNNITSVENCPFVKGETIGICSKTDPNVTAQIQTDMDVDIMPPIANIEMDGARVRIDFGAGVTRRNANADSTSITSGNFVLYSSAIDQERNNQAAPPVEVFAALGDYAATYEISDVELVLQQVNLDPRYESGMMAKIREGGVIDFDIISATNYKHSLLASNRNATVDLPLSNTRAKSCCVVCTDAGVDGQPSYTVPQRITGCRGTAALDIPYSEEDTDMDVRLQSNRTGLVGIIDNLTSYQWVINDRLTPSRPVSTSKINGGKSISAQHLIELEKGLNQSRIVPRSFCDYNRNFVISRAYALNDGVADLNNKTNQLQLLYNESTAAGADVPPLHNKLLMCFVYHLRRISIKGDSVVVTV